MTALRTGLLGGLTPATFLRKHWQKRPLLVRQAFPAFAGLPGLDPHTFLELATRDDATSRLVIDHGRKRGGSAGSARRGAKPPDRSRWERHDGPFGDLDAALLPASHWTVLVHGLERLVPGAWDVLRAFDFLPAARIDDLMVSYAAPGGSVGPHVDDYDVFLLQGPGRRRWQTSKQTDLDLDPRAAIKVLSDFRPDAEWVLEPGDMLYLPPGVAHHGVAEDACFTYSIGFLAPTHQELIESYCGYLAGTNALDGRYTDPDRKPTRDPIAVDPHMLAHTKKLLRTLDADPALFLGCFLTRPHPQARFSPPRARARALSTLALALPTRALIHGTTAFLNGAAYPLPARDLRTFATLARDRRLPEPVRCGPSLRALLDQWLSTGALVRS